MSDGLFGVHDLPSAESAHRDSVLIGCGGDRSASADSLRFHVLATPVGEHRDSPVSSGIWRGVPLAACTRGPGCGCGGPLAAAK